MKYSIAASIFAAAALSACSSSPKLNVAQGKGAELKNISRICIIPNAKRTPKGLENVIAQSLKNHGIESETVNPDTDRRRLYEPACRYNLRYVSSGSPARIDKITLILRTPDYSVATLGYNVNGDRAYLSSPNLQRQTDGIIARLLGKNAQ